jgi:hypothetical protein
VPAFLILRNRVSASALNCGLAGALVASIPWLILGLVSNPDQGYSHGHVTHENGVKTWWSWIDLLTFVAEIAALGAFAGVVFWTVAAAGTKQQT